MGSIGDELLDDAVWLCSLPITVIDKKFHGKVLRLLGVMMLLIICPLWFIVFSLPSFALLICGTIINFVNDR